MSLQSVKSWARVAMLSAALPAGIASAAAVDEYFAAVPAEVTLPGQPAPTPMWGFVRISSGAPCPSGPVAWNVGPQIDVAPGDDLTIHLLNCLSEPTSVMAVGQLPTTATPVIVAGRAKSLTSETGPGAIGSYQWNNVKAGTFLYRSGTRLATQVPMGLYGALVVGGGSTDRLFVYSELDVAAHAGTPAPATPRGYAPTYFLVNGSPNSSGSPVNTGSAGQQTRLRLVNAGLQSRVPTLVGGHLDFVAEDGNPYPFPRRQVGALLAPGKTLDALFTPSKTGSFALYDRMLALSTNNGAGGGMLSRLQVGSATAVANAGPNQTGILMAAPAPVVLDGSASSCGLACASYAWTLTQRPAGSTAVLSGASTVSASFTPDVPGLYAAALVVDGSTPDAVSIVTNLRPVADAGAAQVANLYWTPQAAQLDGGASADPDNGPAPLAHTWTFTATPAGSAFSGASLSGATPSFTPDLVGAYALALAVSDSDLSSAPANVSVSAISQNERPIAIGDNANLLAGASTSPPWNLIDRPGALTDDYDANGFTDIYQASPLFADLRIAGPAATCPVLNPNPLCATVGGVAPANTYVTARGGWVTNNLNGTVTYRRRPGFRGSDSFNYRIFDRGGLGSNLAMVRVNAK